MTPQILQWLQRTKQQVGQPHSILEVGSLNVNGSVRSVYGQAERYVGIDMRAGKDVDKVMNGHDILKEYGPGSFEMVVCCETLEHDDQFWVTVENMREVTSKWMIITNPGTAVIRHNYPGDYYRFFSDAYKYFFRGFNDVWIQETPDNNAPATTQICGIGQKISLQTTL